MHGASRPEKHLVSLEYPYEELTGAIIGAGYTVHNTHGFGFLERVYLRALVVELTHLGISSQREVPFNLYHRGVPIGLYKADLIVESRVVVEIKTGLHLVPAVVPQTLNYLKASDLLVGLVIYFGPSLKVKRVTNFLAPRERPSSGESGGHG